jgi:hypothetical protein
MASFRQDYRNFYSTHRCCPSMAAFAENPPGTEGPGSDLFIANYWVL